MPSLNMSSEGKGLLCAGIYDGEPLADAEPAGLMSKNQAFDNEYTRSSDTR